MTYEELLRQTILSGILDKMTDDEKQQLVLYMAQEQSRRDILDALNRQHVQIDRMSQKMERQGWLTDFGSDVAANFLTDGLIWLARRLFTR